MEEPWASYILRAKDPGEGRVTDSETTLPPRRWRIHRREAGQEEAKVKGDKVGQ